MLAIYGFPQSAEEISAGPGEAMAFLNRRSEYIEPGGNSYDAQFKQLDQDRESDQRLGLAAVLGAKAQRRDCRGQAHRSQPRRQHHDGDRSADARSDRQLPAVPRRLLAGAQAGSSFINRDFLATTPRAPRDPSAAAALYAGTITQETLLNQLEAGEVLGDEFDVEEEIEATQTGGLIEMNQPDPRNERRRGHNARRSERRLKMSWLDNLRRKRGSDQPKQLLYFAKQELENEPTP